jgi:hypothetical protein
VKWTSPMGRKWIPWLASVAVVSLALNVAAGARAWGYWRGEAQEKVAEAQDMACATVAGVKAPTVALEGYWTVTLTDGTQRQGMVGLRAGMVEVSQGSDMLKVPAAKVKSITR